MNLSTTFASLRKTVAGLSLVTLVAGMVATGVASAATSHIFGDVPAEAWFAPYVNGLADAGVIDTTKDNYLPNNNVNRAEMAKFAFNVSGLPLEHASAKPFNDVELGQWYTDYVYTLQKNGIVSGDKNANGTLTGTFRPTSDLNRAEATKMLVNAAQMAEDISGAPHFPMDVHSSDWFYNFVETAFNNGVVSGYPDGTFGPGKSINRAEAAKMVYLSMNPPTAGFTLDSAASASTSSVELIFSMNVEEASSEMKSNYTIEDSNGNPLTVTGATMTASDTVMLTTATQTKGKVYYVTAKNVKSDAGEDLTNSDSVSFLGYGADVSGGDLHVALSTETPVAGSIPQGATGVVFTCWDFSAPGAESAVVKSLTVHRQGPGEETAFNNVYLYNGDSRITTGRSINNSTQTVTFSNINQNVLAGANPIKLCLVADLSTTSSGGVHAFELTAADDVISNSSDMTGSFPLRGADQLVTSATVGTSTIKKNGSLDEVTIGSTDARIAQFEIDAGSSEDQQLQRIALYVRGRATSSALQNIKLYAEGDATPVATASSVGDNDLVTLVLATPYKIAKGDTKIFHVTADIVGARTGDDVKVYIDEATDVFVKGVTFGYGTQVNIDSYDGDDLDATPGTSDDEYSYVLLKGSKFTIAFNGPVAGDVAVNQKQAHCMDVTLTNAAGLDVTIKDWVVDMTASGPEGLLDGSNVGNYTQIELARLNDDGTVAGVLLGSSELSSTGNDLTQQVTLKGTADLASGESVKAAIIMDVANNNLLNGETLKCSLEAPIGNDQVKDSNNDPLGAANITPSSTIGGNTLSLVTSALTFTKNSSPANFTKIAKGTNNAVLLAFQAKAGSALDTTIKSLTVHGDHSLAGTTTATATVTEAGGVVTAVPVTTGGSGYVTAPTVTITDAGCGTVPTATANISNGVVSSITVTGNGTAGCTGGTALIAAPTLSLPTTDIKDLVDSIGIYDATSGTLLSDLKSFPASVGAANDATVTFNNLTIPVAKNGTANLVIKGMVSNSIASAAAVTFNLSGVPLVIDGKGQTVTGVDITAVDGTTPFTDELALILGSSPSVGNTVTAANDPKMFAETQTNPVFAFTLKSTDGNSTLQDLTVNVHTTGALLPVDYIALYSATSSGMCNSGTTLLKDYESVIASTAQAGLVKFTNINQTLTDSQNMYYCVFLKSKTVSSGQPVSNTDIVLGTDAANTDTVVFNKVQDQSGTNIVVPSITPATPVVSSAFFKGVPTFTVATNDSVLTSSTDILKFTAGSVGSVSSLNQFGVTFSGAIPTSCDLYRGPDSANIGTLLTTIPVFSGVFTANSVVFQTSDFVGAVPTPWTNGNVYTVKCNYAVASGDSSTAQLAPLAMANQDAIVWNDSNGANVTDLTDATGFGRIDSILFFSTLQGQKASAAF